MAQETKTTDSKARVILPRGFASTTVVVDQLSDTEVRIRKAIVIPEDEVRFYEESAVKLSDRDRDRFLDLLDNPPPATDALRRAFQKQKERHD